jgi:type IV secretory pathway TraG/TraD family ATPase VirD4
LPLGIQTIDQLRKEYGRAHAEALLNLPVNLLTSQVTGDSAKFTSELIGNVFYLFEGFYRLCFAIEPIFQL